MTDTQFDAVVVGSGFGGSVMAYRLAEAGLSVCLLERGRPYPPGSFARSPHTMRDNLWDPDAGLRGLYDVWRFRKIDALVSAGLGGGSLIYANVLIRKDEHWFVREARNPQGYEYWPVTRADLEPHYDVVEKMIGVRRYPEHLLPLTAKAREFQAAGRRQGFDSGPLPLAITFSEAGAPLGEPIPGSRHNLHNQTRTTCRLCGECDLGCNYGSKNTLDYNYLSEAKRLQADIRTLCEVRCFSPLPDGRYRIEYEDHNAVLPGEKAPVVALTTQTLVLSAGTIGSTYLMLRNRSSFPRLSGQLGTRFSGNGDILGMAIDCTKGDKAELRFMEPSRGPVITSYVRVPDAVDGGTGRGHYVEDAGFPELFNWLIEVPQTTLALHPLLRMGLVLLRKATGRDRNSHMGSAIHDLLGECRTTRSSLPMLGMGRDIADGVMRLADDIYMDIDWNTTTSTSFFEGMHQTMRALAQALGGKFQDNPMWYSRQLITVHPLGGCPMGRDREEGVVDNHGEVFGYPGLFVADGSVMPGPVGPNPSLTIAALSHRFADRVIARVTAARTGLVGVPTP